MFRKRRDWFSSNFTQVVYEEWLREAYLLGRIGMKNYGRGSIATKLGVVPSGMDRSQGQLDPLKEV